MGMIKLNWPGLKPFLIGFKSFKHSYHLGTKQVNFAMWVKYLYNVPGINFEVFGSFSNLAKVDG